jgi:hypothetical protein
MTMRWPKKSSKLDLVVTYDQIDRMTRSELHDLAETLSDTDDPAEIDMLKYIEELLARKRQ